MDGPVAATMVPLLLATPAALAARENSRAAWSAAVVLTAAVVAATRRRGSKRALALPLPYATSVPAGWGAAACTRARMPPIRGPRFLAT